MSKVTVYQFTRFMTSPLLADIVAKVFLHRWPKILRAVDAIFL
jgi:hypothetical protein